MIKFRHDIRNTFRKELNVKAYENAVGKQQKPAVAKPARQFGHAMQI